MKENMQRVNWKICVIILKMERNKQNEIKIKVYEIKLMMVLNKSDLNKVFLRLKKILMKFHFSGDFLRESEKYDPTILFHLSKQYFTFTNAN